MSDHRDNAKKVLKMLIEERRNLLAKLAASGLVQSDLDKIYRLQEKIDVLEAIYSFEKKTAQKSLLGT